MLRRRLLMLRRPGGAGCGPAPIGCACGSFICSNPAACRLARPPAAVGWRGRTAGAVVRGAVWAAFALACMWLPETAAAHGSLLAAEPAPMTTVDIAPPEVALFFGGVILAEGSSLTVTGPDGRPIDAGDVRVDGAAMRVSLRRARPAGTYAVFWQIRAADGHEDRGAFAFSAARATGHGSGGALRWVGPFVTAGLLVGLVAAAFVIWRALYRAGPPGGAAPRARRPSPPARRRR